MNIKAVWYDPDYSCRLLSVTIVATEWIDGNLMALTIDTSGHFKHLPINELQVIDDKYLP